MQTTNQSLVGALDNSISNLYDGANCIASTMRTICEQSARLDSAMHKDALQSLFTASDTLRQAERLMLESEKQISAAVQALKNPVNAPRDG